MQVIQVSNTGESNAEHRCYVPHFTCVWKVTVIYHCHNVYWQKISIGEGTPAPQTPPPRLCVCVSVCLPLCVFVCRTAGVGWADWSVRHEASQWGTDETDFMSSWRNKGNRPSPLTDLFTCTELFLHVCFAIRQVLTGFATCLGLGFLKMPALISSQVKILWEHCGRQVYCVVVYVCVSMCVCVCVCVSMCLCVLVETSDSEQRCVDGTEDQLWQARTDERIAEETDV